MRVLKIKIIHILFNKFSFLKLLFLLTTGVNWIWLKIISHCNKKINIRDILLNNYALTSDNDMRLFCDKGIWKNNNYFKNLEKLIHDYCAYNHISDYKKYCMIFDFKEIFKEKILLSNISKQPIIGQEMKFKKHPLKSHHIFSKDITKKDFSYITDYKSADENDNYNREVIIDEFVFSKKSKILDQIEDNIYLHSNKEIIIPKTQLIIGAIKGGYNEKLLNNSLDFSIKNTIKLTDDLNKFAEEYNIDISTITFWRDICLTDYIDN